METKEIKYTKRFNIGNYEHEEFSITAVTEDGSVEDFAQLKETVAKAFVGEEVAKAKVSRSNKAKEVAPEPEEEETEEAEEEEKPKATKGKASKAKAKKVEEPEESEEEEAEEAEEEEEEEEKPKAKALKKKGSTYSRNSDLHKKLFVEMLNEELGEGWVKKNAGRAKTASIKMEGKNFLDADGEILPEFTKETLKIAKAK